MASLQLADCSKPVILLKPSPSTHNPRRYGSSHQPPSRFIPRASSSSSSPGASASVCRRRFIADTASVSLSVAAAPLLGAVQPARAEDSLSEWERVYLPIDPGVGLLDIAFVPDDPNHENGERPRVHRQLSREISNSGRRERIEAFGRSKAENCHSESASDEPESSVTRRSHERSRLALESEFLVQDAMDSLMRGRTVLVIAHRLSTVKTADTVAVVSDGQIAEMGTHDHLLSRDGIYTALVRRQLQGYKTA